MGTGRSLVGQGSVIVSGAVGATLTGSSFSVAIEANLLNEFLVGGFND